MDLQCAKVKNPCKFCLQGVTNKNGLQCMGACGRWAHYKCLSYTPGKISDIKAGLIKVTCPCPDCNTSQPKEFLKNPPYSCSNHECPANKLPKCDSSGCPANRKNVVSFPSPPSPEYKDPCSPVSSSPNSPSSPASPDSRECPPRNPPTCIRAPTPPTPPSPPSCPPSPPRCPAKPRCYSPCPPCCPGPTNAPPCPVTPPPCPPNPPKCPPPPPKCPPPPPKCPPPPPKNPPPPPKCPPPKCPPRKCSPPKCPPPKCPPPKCPSTPRCRTPSPSCKPPPCSKPKSPRCPSSQKPTCPPPAKPSCFPASPPTPPCLVQNYSATRRPNHSVPQQPAYVDVGTPMKSPSCSVLSYDVPEVSSSFEKTSSVVLMANNSDYSMNAYDEDIPQEEAALKATSATQIPEERDNNIYNSPSFDYQCSQTYISSSLTQIAYDPEETMVSNLQKMNAAIDQLSSKIKSFMKKVEMRER
ncbi:unnamed protein product [Arctia plantaginis]|uniref:Uncharacterized protein n=1 Tax=Arctia plantaginis TaxID=874455 RepID=A0A8S0Z7C0_ARCPL|nr:unnamed protein product [Arctia plantaginis]CAB3258463.1 unnamed protein product [Arctia plantaginis]